MDSKKNPSMSASHVISTCLDHVFEQKVASCLVNPFACHETEMPKPQTTRPQTVIVVGAGMAGLACAVTAAECGHSVELWEKSTEIGGQFNMAKRIPGKGEFYETLKYYSHQLDLHGVTVKLNHPIPLRVKARQADKIILATGVHPRPITLPGIDHPNVLDYVDVLNTINPLENGSL